MKQLSYGYYLPESPDSGAQFFGAMATNIQKLNDHTHDGSGSAIISQGTLDVAQGSFSADGTVTGLFKATVTMPTGRTFDASTMTFRLADGTYFYPSVVKLSNTSFRVYMNDPQDITVGFVS